jgi:hypothetical protein
VFSYSSFRVLDLTLRSLIYLELIFVQDTDRDLVSDYCMWISSLPNTICWRDIFSNVCFWFLCQKSDGCSWVSLFLSLLLYCIGLPSKTKCFCSITMIFLLLWLCSITWSQVLWYLHHFSFPSRSFWLFRICYSSIWIFKLIFLFLWRMTLEFWWRLHWICTLLLVVQPF